jgi:hypothetical protein
MSDQSSLSASVTVIRRRSLFRRVHMWAALIASPFAIIAVLTGLFYVATPQIEHWRYDSLEQVVPQGQPHPLDELVSAAVQQAPVGAQLNAVFIAPSEGASVKVLFMLPNAEQISLYVNPYTAKVIGRLAEADRFSVWAKKLHSRLLQGESWRWMIELAASWLLVMLVSGVYLWWPSAGQSALPTSKVKAGYQWSRWHGFVGVALCALTFIMLSTGITWSKYAGSQVRALRDYVGQAPPQAPKDLSSVVRFDVDMMSWQTAFNTALKLAPNVAMQLTPPRSEIGVWRVVSADKSKPFRKFELVMDAYTGAPLYFAGWQQQTAFSKATALGIPFHRGELGLWNQFLLIVFALGIAFSLVSGWWSYFTRCRQLELRMPVVLPGALQAMPLFVWLFAIGLLVLLPLLAISVIVVLLIEGYLYTMQRTRS